INIPKAQNIMQFFNIALLLPLVLSSAIANPVREEVLPGQVSVAGDAPAELAKRGFGCPNDQICNDHVSYDTACIYRL
ncbi:MAG: hypothetical protein Q9182_007548, partial [Xanthomendoza sp. 2 TL-2023]